MPILAPGRLPACVLLTMAILLGGTAPRPAAAVPEAPSPEQKRPTISHVVPYVLEVWTGRVARSSADRAARWFPAIAGAWEGRFITRGGGEPTLLVLRPAHSGAEKSWPFGEMLERPVLAHDRGTPITVLPDLSHLARPMSLPPLAPLAGEPQMPWSRGLLPAPAPPGLEAEEPWDPGATRPVALLVGARAIPVAVEAGIAPPQVLEAGAAPTRVTLLEGRSKILPARALRTVQIDDATGAIAEVQPLSDSEVLLLAKGPGVTMVRVWDQDGRAEYELTVEPGPAHQQQIIQEAIGTPDVKVRVVEGTAILEGDVKEIEEIARAQRIAQVYVARVVNLLRVPPPPPKPPEAPKPPPGPTLAEQVQSVLPEGEVTAEALPGQPNIIILRGKVPRTEDLEAFEKLAGKVVEGVQGAVVNLIQLAQPRQVRVQARMVSVDENLLRDLGIRWTDQATYGQTVPQGTFRLQTAIQADIRAIVDTSRAEVLAAPSVVVNSGGTGNITIGGELPIPMVVTGVAGTTGGTGGGAGQAGVGTVGQSVFFRQFGVLLNIEPIVEPGEEITLRLLAEVSAVDRNNGIVINGSNIPGFSTKRTITELRLRAGDTLVIGGLISRDEANAVHKFPILGDLPIFGNFFRSVRREKQTRELVLFLTPELLPGPEPPAGLRQTPVFKPLENMPIGFGSVGTSGSGTGTGGQSGGAGGMSGGSSGMGSLPR